MRGNSSIDGSNANSKNVLISMTNSIVCFFFFFCQLTSIVESHGISQIDELSLRENIDALPRAILSIVLCTKDENLSSNR